MAPSRALLRCISSTPSKPATATLLLRPLSRSHCTSVVGLQHSTRLTTPTSRRVRSTHLAITSTRSYSQPASSAPEPPDYLNEAELHIFHKIKQELDPVKLEVCMFSTCATEIGALAYAELTPMARGSILPHHYVRHIYRFLHVIS